MFRHIQKLVILLISWSIVLLLPIFTASANPIFTASGAAYRNIPSKYRGTIDSPLESNFDSYIKSRRHRKILAGTDRTSFVVYDISKNKK